MEAINSTPASLEIFVDPKEYFALLRPTGMLAEIISARPELGAALKLKQFEQGSVLLVTPETVLAIVNGSPAHAVDDRLRFIVARWNRELVSPPGAVV